MLRSGVHLDAWPARIVALTLLLLLAGCAVADGGRGASDAAPLEQVDRSCKLDADCEVKNVGNCCGYFPACVNRASPTFPEQVRARCEAEGTLSVCGFEEIRGCRCVEGRCAADRAAGADGLPVD